MAVDLRKLNIKYPSNMNRIYVRSMIESNFIQFLEHYREIISEEDFQVVFYNHLENFRKEKVERIKKLYPKFLNKKYSNEHVISEIINFDVDEKDIKNNIKYHFYAFVVTYDSLSDAIKKLIDNKKVDFNNAIFRSKLQLLKRVLLDIEELLPVVEKLFGNTPKSSLHMNRSLDGYEIFWFTNLYANGILDFSNQTYFFTYAFLLRQSIEIRLKRALGIYAIIKNRKQVKITSDRFVDFVYMNNSIKFPDLKKSILKKIFYWANYHIHNGAILYSWQFYLINEYLKPLFQSAQNESQWHISGSISMPKKYYETNLRKDLEDYLRKSNIEFDEIVFCDKPEALLEK